MAKLAKRLRSDGLATWYSERHVIGAQQWHDEIGTALERCDWFAVVLSPSSVRSEWVKHELLYALGEPRYRRRIVPILHRRCQVSRLSWTLNSFQNVDFTKGFEPGYTALLRVWAVAKQSAGSNARRSPSRSREAKRAGR